MEYPTADEIHMLHNRIVVQNSNPESGIRNAAAIESDSRTSPQAISAELRS
jgi:hypothetical protein